MSNLTPEEFKKWASNKRADLVIKYAVPGAQVVYASSVYEVAHQKTFPHGVMIGIYDEPPSKHVDYISPRSLRLSAKTVDAISKQ